MPALSSEVLENGGRGGAQATLSGLQRRCLLELALRPGQRVLDLGCGADADGIELILALALAVGSSGQVHGVDNDAAAVQRARQRSLRAAVAGWVTHHHAHATALPWAASFFDAAVCHGVLQHLHAPMHALHEMVRVLRAGGRLVVAEPDWATLSIDSDDDGVERRVVRAHAEVEFNNPFSGRQLHRLFAACGLGDVSVDVWPVVGADLQDSAFPLQLDKLTAQALRIGAAEAPDLSRWQSALERAGRRRACFASVNFVLATGYKP